jgi:uncharacterized protein
VIFVDTSFWAAIHLRRDSWHRTAASLLDKHRDARMVTTNVVRGETWTLLRGRDGHDVATTFLDRLDQSPRVELITVQPEVEEQALTWLRRHDERAYSFADATSFALMRAKRITEALAFDSDFSAAGFVELRP